MSKFADTQTEISVALAAQAQELRRIGIGLTNLRNVVENNVLGVETGKFDANGIFTKSYQQRFASVVVRNHNANNPITVTNEGPSPTGVNTGMTGVGVWTVPAGVKDTINMAGETLTMYGAAGSLVSFQVLSRVMGV